MLSLTHKTPQRVNKVKNKLKLKIKVSFDKCGMERLSFISLYKTVNDYVIINIHTYFVANHLSKPVF